MKEDPSQSLNVYKTSTSGLLDYVKNQLSAVVGWTNVQGSLVKVSSSPAGYTWGLNSAGGLYVCKNPCSPPNWKFIEKYEGFKDIATDNTLAYVLLPNHITKYQINGEGSPTSIQLDSKITALQPERLTVTNGFIQLYGKQGATAKIAICAKPCSPPSWSIKDATLTQDNKVLDQYTLLGAGGNHTYFKSSVSGDIYKSDQTTQTGFAPVAGLQGINASTLAAEADNSVLYAADNTKLYRCAGTCESRDQLSVVNTEGRIPIQNKGSIAMNPNDRMVWMNATDSASGGNIFQRLDAASDMSPVLNYANQTDNQRDRIVNSLGADVAVQTAQISSNMAKREVANVLGTLTDLTGDKDKADIEIQTLKGKIQASQNQIAGYNVKQKPMIVLLICLAIVAGMYLTVGWFLPYWASMGIAVVVLGTGLGLAIYFSTTK